MNILLKQEGRESYGDEAVEGATAILQGDDEFVGADDEFEAACAGESATRARSQRAVNLSGHATGTANECEDDKAEENTARNRTRPLGNPVEQVTGEVETIFRGGNIWGNKRAPPPTPRKLGIPGVASVIITQQATTFPVGGNAPMARTTAQNLQRVMMGGNTTLNNTVVRMQRNGGSNREISSIITNISASSMCRRG